MFEAPSVIIMTIAVSRMHRALVDFASGPGQSEYETLFTSLLLPTQRGQFLFRVNTPPGTLLFSKTKPSTALDRIEVVVDTTFEQHSKGTKSETRSEDSSSILVSTSEYMLETVVNLSKLNHTQEHGYPPHPSPIPQKQDV